MKALVIGGARSGIAVAHLLNREGYAVTLTTNQTFDQIQELKDAGITISLDDRDMSLVDDYDIVVKNPGIPNEHPLVSQFPVVLNEIEVATRFSQSYNYYAVSGTNGKTTTVTLLHEMLLAKASSALLAGNVGYALSDAVFRDRDFVRDVALEISAFQMEGTPTFAPKVYGLLNLSPDHLDRYASVQDYYNAKLSILPRVGTFVRNIDDANIASLTHEFQGNVIDISLTSNADVMMVDGVIVYDGIPLFNRKDLKLVGDHNVMNAAMAATIAYLAGVSIADIANVIASFAGVEHRIEFVAEIDSIRYYNDSKATNPESTEVCLRAFDQPIILLAGGYDKHISFEILRPYTHKIKKLFVFGESAQQIKEIFPDAFVVKTMKEAFDSAKNVANSGDIVVLSPACASYDQFDNFEQRGNIYKEYVKTLQ